jgi:hypothetical protein
MAMGSRFRAGQADEETRRIFAVVGVAKRQFLRDGAAAERAAR